MTEANLRNLVAVCLSHPALTLLVTLAVILPWCSETSLVLAAEEIGVTQVLFNGKHTYQAPTGDIHFTVTGDVKSQPQLRAFLCWKLKENDQNKDQPDGCKTKALPVRQVKANDNPSWVEYAVTIPRTFTSKPSGDDVEENIFKTVPIAALTIKWGGNEVSHEIGITKHLYAALAATIAVLCAGIGFYRFAIYLGVPGPTLPSGIGGSLASLVRGYSVPLRLISTSNGWASLAQFQIILWTFVIGAGAVYVMTLTMSLITISIGTLALLGIAGTTTVLAELKNSQGSQTPSTLTSPGKVTYLASKGGPQETEILANWYAPVGITGPIHYLVQYLDPASPGVWRTACRALRTTSVRIVGLSPGTAYQVRVVAVNFAGMGPEETITAPTAQSVKTIPPPSIPDLQMQAGRTGTSIPLAWTKVDGAAYALEKRLHDSDTEWTTIALEEPNNHKATVSNLIPNTAYDFRVRDNASPNAWSSIKTFNTDIRTPKWSDLVTDTDRPAEIDVTRVQMLFFTVISAVFVAVNILETGTIPAIDNTYVTLMGISNGVYVTTKFVRV